MDLANFNLSMSQWLVDSKSGGATPKLLKKYSLFLSLTCLACGEDFEEIDKAEVPCPSKLQEQESARLSPCWQKERRKTLRGAGRG